MKSLALALLAFATLAYATANPSPPFWGAGNFKKFMVNVNMTNPSPVSFWQFKYTYDATTRPSPASRYEHQAPQYDEMCAGLPFNASFDCTVIFATNGWSYILFPAAGFCCQCENSFGAVRVDWLQQNATMEGTTTVRGIQVQKWVKMGGQGPNNVYVTDDAVQRTVRFDEMWGNNGEKHLKAWDFDMASYSLAPFDSAKLLGPPKGCTQQCNNWCRNYR